MVHLHTVEYYADVRKSKVMTFAYKWMALENIMQSENESEGEG